MGYIDSDGDDADFASDLEDDDDDVYGMGATSADGGGMGQMYTPHAVERFDSATQNERGLGGGVNWAGKYDKILEKKAEKEKHTLGKLSKRLEEEGDMMCTEARDLLKSEILEGMKHKFTMHIKTFLEEREKARQVEMIMPKNRDPYAMRRVLKKHTKERNKQREILRCISLDAEIRLARKCAEF